MDGTTPDQTAPTPAPLRVLGMQISSREDLGFIDFAVNRWTGILALVGLILGAFVFPSQGYALETCAMIRTLNLPCPGCGLTRSVTSIYHGHFLAAWQYNPFGYVFAFGFLALAPMALLPQKMAEAVKARIRPYSYPIALFLIVFISGLMLHGIVRASLVATRYDRYAWWSDRPRVPPAFAHLLEEPASGEPVSD